MKIKATDQTIKDIVIVEIERIEKLIELKAIDVNEINLNHIDVSSVTNMNELFKDMALSKPLNIENWDLPNITTAVDMKRCDIMLTNPEMWRI